MKQSMARFMCALLDLLQIVIIPIWVLASPFILFFIFWPQGSDIFMLSILFGTLGIPAAIECMLSLFIMMIEEFIIY